MNTQSPQPNAQPMASFAEEVDAYTRPFLGTFGYEGVRNGHLDISRFDGICATVDGYQPIRGSVVLSSGCGSAGDLAVCLKMGASRVYGIEVDPGLHSLGQARFRGHPAADRIDLRRYEGRELPYADATFDLIMSMHVVEHVQDAEVYMRELFRVMRPGGVLFLELPNRHYWQEQHTLVPWIHMPPNPVRNALMRLMLSPLGRPWLTLDLRQKLTALLDLLHPTPADLTKLFNRYRTKFDLQLVEASFYGAAGAVPQAAAGGMHILRRLHLPTFRLVVRRHEGTS